MRDGLFGRRVVLRRQVGHREGRPTYTDLLGELVEINDTHLVVRRDDGATVTVPQRQVHRLRPVPPGTADVLALERVAALGWPAPHTTRLGEWVLRAGEGWTRRANSALPLGDPGMPVDAALRRVREWYLERELVPRLAVPLPAMAAADATARRLGWSVDVDAEVLIRRHLALGAADPEVTLAATPNQGWAAVYSKRLPPVGMGILTAPEQVTFASIVQSGATVAIGRGVVIGDWLGVSAMEVLATHRGRGLARRVLRTLLVWGAGRGAARCYLQVESTNTPALSLYHGEGFTRHHRYRTRLGP